MAAVRVAAAMLGRLLLLLLLLAFVASDAYDGGSRQPPISRRSFPEGFIFGTASSAYQYEGGAMEGGRGPSIWDTFTHQHPDKIADRSNADTAVDSYHRYKQNGKSSALHYSREKIQRVNLSFYQEDVRIMKDMGVDAYRFSISWTRILRNGSLSGGINREGIMYYNNLIDELVSKGVQPFVTLFHWDSPQALEDKYGGFLSPNIINDYKDYAEVCIKEFGDRVKHWITFNEPWSFCATGYAWGVFPPGRCSPWEQGKCSAGDSAREPYTAVQKGKIGITLVTNWFVPFSRSRSNDDAARRALDFMFGWFMDPLIRGHYPLSMRRLVGNRLPQFTTEQSKLVKGAFDFIGLNYYTANYAANLPPTNGLNLSYSTDSRANLTGVRNGMPIGPRVTTTTGNPVFVECQAASPWLYIYPQGFRDLLLYVKENYGNPTVYITENGVDEINNKSLPLQQALKDSTRIEYYHKHLLALQSAISHGANVKGYFAWSLLDNFEWVNGYTVRFGIDFVDYSDGLKRYPKSSAHWFKEFLKK